MKKVRFILPAVAIMIAVAGVFATGSAKSAVANVDVSAVLNSCNVDGQCTNVTTPPTCQITSAGVTFYDTNISGCSTAAKGLFRQ